VSSLNELDIRHLRIFLALCATKNVTRAADSVGLSQSSVSVVLAQLRQHYGDPLFVRTSGGMKATPRAEALRPLVYQALKLLEQCLEPSLVFDPLTSSRCFRICMPDLGQTILLPRLLSVIDKQAPNVNIEVSNLSYETARQLETGEADIALGFTEEMKAGFYKQKLNNERFVLIASKNHPDVDGKMSLAQLQQQKFVKVMLTGTSHSIIEKFLERKGIVCNYVANVPNFIGLGQIVASSSLVAIVPLRLGIIFESENAVKMVQLPLKFPSYTVNQFWHERFHRDPANMWLRSLIHDTSETLEMENRTNKAYLW